MSKVPEGWVNTKLSELTEKTKNSFVIGPFGSDLVQSDYRTEGTPVIFVRDVKKGGVKWISNVFVTKEKYKKLIAHSVIPGDIVITKMGLPPGIAAVYPENYCEGVITADIIRMRPNNNIVDSHYLSCVLNSHKVMLQVFQRTGGQTRPKLTLTDYKTIEVTLPYLAEQQKIAKILSTWDKAISVTEQLINNSQQQKNVLRKILLGGKKRLPAFFEAWVAVPFGKAFKVANKKSSQVNSSEYLATGNIPVVDQSQKAIAGYTNHEDPYIDIPVIVFGDHTRALKWVDFVFVPGADGTQVLKTKEILLEKFGYYLLENTEIPNLGYSRHMRELKENDFMVPLDKQEQQKIAKVLTAADREIELLQLKLAGLKQEKQALMQQLLTGKRRVVV